MGAESVSVTRWRELPIECPYCGNHGQEKQKWTTNAAVPFKLVEEVVRSWEFSSNLDDEGKLCIIGDADSDVVDWESGTGLRFECMSCFGQFPIPPGTEVDFE